MKGIYLMKKPIIKPEQGKRLKAALKYRNKSQKWLSDNAHISQPTISDIINGKVRLTEQNALLFSRVLDISLKYLLLESDYITSEEKPFSLVPFLSLSILATSELCIFFLFF